MHFFDLFERKKRTTFKNGQLAECLVSSWSNSVNLIWRVFWMSFMSPSMQHGIMVNVTGMASIWFSSVTTSIFSSVTTSILFSSVTTSRAGFSGSARRLVALGDKTTWFAMIVLMKVATLKRFVRMIKMVKVGAAVPLAPKILALPRRGGWGWGWGWGSAGDNWH